MTIKLKVDKKRTRDFAHTITADQPVRIEVDVIRGVPIITVYDKENPDDLDEPIGVYDGGMGATNNKSWTYDPYFIPSQ